ncbi:MAG TPA: Stp1/IreP family PP2C-type Ser/Thr phosphatase [Acidimicrobiia bacterium]|nr:Stp1/IreP family PP2C-type Ser/Thr phosphatase [Acidimicrobiia bacterium]
MKLAAAASTHQGLVRDNNEDAFLIDDRRGLFAVADGMGGHRGGEVASRTAIEALRASVAADTALNHAIERANDAVITRAAGDDDLAGMGTTLTAVVVVGGHQLLVGHVGDSRAYVVHDGTLRRVTDDHSLVEELVREGRLTPEQAEAHPQRAIITRALGVDTDVEVDLYTLDVVEGDRVVLCSDGLTTMVRERDVERIARGEHDPQRAADALVDAANAAGGEDNITVVVIDVLEVDPPAPPDPTALLPAQEPDEHPRAEPEQEPAEDAPTRQPRPRGTRLRTARGVVLVLLPLVVIVGVAAGALGWYARSSYFVGASGDEVVVFKGVPGGVLGWNPTVYEHTGIRVADLPPVDQDRVRSNTARGSRATADDYVARLRTATTTTTEPTTTTTTRPRTATTRPRATTTTTPRHP